MSKRRWNREIVWAIAQKDIRAITRSKQIWIGMIALPLAFCLVLPLILVLVMRNLDVASWSADTVTFAEDLIGGLPAGDLQSFLLALPSLQHQMLYMAVNYLITPLFLLIPVITAGLIAANSFVGEKERRTLESLLFAPLEIRDLFLGKILATFLPTMVITYGGFLLYAVVVNALAYPMFGQLIVPTWDWAVLMLWLIPSVVLVTILLNVLISARVKGFQEAQQLGGVIVLPVVALMVGQLSGALLLSATLIGIIGGVLFLISFLLLRTITKRNQRHVLFEKQVH